MEQKELIVPTDNKEGPEYITCNVKRYDPTDDTSPVTTYFLENQEYYEQRANVYGYADDTTRWALLCRGALEFLRNNKNWTPDVIVSSDWQTGLIPNLLKTKFKSDPILSKIASVFSIHNLFFQAMFDHKFVSEMDYDDGHSELPAIGNPRLEKINWMKRGIIYTDVINTVSPNYAREIMTKEYGELLDDLIRERRGVLSGILNGLDYTVWNPETDTSIPFHFNVNNLDQKALNKTALQQHFGLATSKNVFLMAIVGRLTKQKGLDILLPIIDKLLEELPLQLVVVGDGEGEFMGFLSDLAKRHPTKVAVHLKFDNILSHLVFAGADSMLAPSRFEPCGLTQIEAMRMGTIPIVRKTGGLADSVDDYSPEKDTGTGFVFEKFDSYSLLIAIVRAFENFRDKKNWKNLQIRAMEKDFSWTHSAKKYVDLFRKAIEIHKNI